MTSTTRDSRFRIPTLFEIFWGKLANWFRQLAKWRKLGLLKKALEAKRRRLMRLETLEPRVLLSADLVYGGDISDPGDAFVTDITLKAESDGTNHFIKLYETGTSNEVGSVEIDDAGDLDLNIKRAGGDIAASAAGDRLRMDLDTLSALDAFVDAHGGVLKLNFKGGTETPLSDDHVNLEGTGTYSVGYGLTITSTSDIIVGVGDITLGGDFSVESEDSIDVGASNIDTGANDLALSVKASSEGIFGVGILGLSDAAITVTGGELSGNDISITATSKI